MEHESYFRQHNSSTEQSVGLFCFRRNIVCNKQKTESQNWCYKKTKHNNFSVKQTFLTIVRTRTYFSENLVYFVFV